MKYTVQLSVTGDDGSRYEGATMLTTDSLKGAVAFFRRVVDAAEPEPSRSKEERK